MIVRQVALTGGIATGKSYVLERFRTRGLPTVDADQLSREVVGPGEPASEEIRRRFGSEYFLPDGELDRARMGERVFSDTGERRELERIVHPRVRARLNHWFAEIEKEGRSPVGIAAIPLLYEAGRDSDFDVVIVTSCDVSRQIRRLIARDHLSKVEAKRRLDCQMDTVEKVTRADFVVWTDGSFESTDRQVELVCDELLSS